MVHAGSRRARRGGDLLRPRRVPGSRGRTRARASRRRTRSARATASSTSATGELHTLNAGPGRPRRPRVRPAGARDGARGSPAPALPGWAHLGERRRGALAVGAGGGRRRARPPRGRLAAPRHHRERRRRRGRDARRCDRGPLAARPGDRRPARSARASSSWPCGRASSASRRTATPPRRSSSSCSRAAASSCSATRSIPVRAGHVIARPPGTGVAHTMRAGLDGLTYLAYGTRVPNDVCFYPRSGKVYLQRRRRDRPDRAARLLGRGGLTPWRPVAPHPDSVARRRRARRGADRPPGELGRRPAELAGRARVVPARARSRGSPSTCTS